MSSSNVSRIEEVDGIRGWAALCVVVFHLSWETFGIIEPQLRFWPTKFFLDGPLAVYVFFILSGDALSYRYILNRNPEILTKSILKRYFRLTMPIAASCLTVFLLMKFGLTWNTQAGAIVHREDWLGQFIQFPPSFKNMLHYALVNVYVNHTLANSYNPFLWTMSIEMIGSLLVFSFLFTINHQKNPIILASLIAIFLAALNTFFSLFFIGIIFSLLRSRGDFKRLRTLPGIQMGTLLSFGAIIVCDALAMRTNFQSMHLSIFLATAAVGVIYFNPTLSRMMSAKISVWLGKISFPLYAFHFSIIVSLTSWLIVKLHSLSALNNANIYAVILASIICSLALAHFISLLEKQYLGWLDNMINEKILKTSL